MTGNTNGVNTSKIKGVDQSINKARAVNVGKAGAAGANISGLAPAADTPRVTPALDKWQSLLGLLLIVVAGIGAVLACLHLGGRVAHLGAGGLKLPSPDAWLGYRHSPGATLMLSTEQLTGVLGAWVTCLAICLGLFTRDVARLGNPHTRSAWREIIEGAVLILFGFLTAFLAVVSMIFMRQEQMMLVGLPMPLVIFPGLLLGGAMLANGVMVLIRALKEPPTAATHPTASRGGASKATSGKAATGKATTGKATARSAASKTPASKAAGKIPATRQTPQTTTASRQTGATRQTPPPRQTGATRPTKGGR